MKIFASRPSHTHHPKIATKRLLVALHSTGLACLLATTVLGQSGSCPTADATFVFGDPSGTGSERYTLTIQANPSSTLDPVVHSWTNPACAAMNTNTVALVRGLRYEIKLTHAGTCRAEGAEYDYYLFATSKVACISIEDPQNLLGDHWLSGFQTNPVYNPGSKVAYITLGEQVALGFDLENDEAAIAPGEKQTVEALWDPAVGAPGQVAWSVSNKTNSYVQFSFVPNGAFCDIWVDENSPSGTLLVNARSDCSQGGAVACDEGKPIEIKVGCSACSACDSAYQDVSSVNSVDIQFPLGLAENGQSAGTVSLHASVPSADLPQPGLLQANALGSTTQVIYKEGVLRQVKTRDTLLHIAVTSNQFYTLEYYPASAATRVDPKSGLWRDSSTYGSGNTLWMTQPGLLLRRYKIRNPNGLGNYNTLELARDMGPGTAAITNRWTYTAPSGGAPTGPWTLTKGISISNPSGLTKETVTEAIVSGDRVKTRTIQEINNTVRSKTETTIKQYIVGGQPVYRVIKEVVDPGGLALTSTHAYDPVTANRTETLEVYSGNYTRWTYDGSNRILDTSRPYPSTSTTVLNTRITRYDYTPVAGAGDSSHPDHARTPRKISEIIKLGATENVMSVTYKVYLVDAGSGEVTEITERAASITAAYGAGGNLRDVDVYHPDSFNGVTGGRVKQHTGSDGLMDLYSYESGTISTPANNHANWAFTLGGDDLRITTHHVTALNPLGIAARTTTDTRLVDRLGRTRLEETHVHVNPSLGQMERVQWTAYELDGLGRAAKTIKSNGTRLEAVYDCCGLNRQISESGAITEYVYDELKRVKSETKLGLPAALPPEPDIVTTYAYDAAGRLLSTTTSGGGISTVRSSTFDVAGRLLTSTDKSGRTTTYTYSADQLLKTYVIAQGASYAVLNYQDGTNRRTAREGTTIHDRNEYAVDTSIAGKPSEVRTVWTGVPVGTTPMWRKEYTNPLGQVFQVDRNAPGGYHMREEHIFDSRGRSIATKNYKKLASASTWTAINDLAELRVYDGLGHAYLTGLDYNGDGALVEASSDRITGNSESYVKIGADWWLERKSHIYPESNSAFALNTSTQRTRLTGFTENILNAEEVSLDRYGNPTISRTTLVPQNRTQIVTTDTPDSTINAVRTTVNGLLRTQMDSLGLVTTHTYDGLGRLLSSSNPASGTTSRTLLSDGRVSTETDAFGKVTTTTYGAFAQVATVTDPAGSVTRYSYDNRGRVEKTWGSGTYPTWVTYDTFGRVNKLYTFRTDYGFSGATWPASATAINASSTTWAYDLGTGLLLSKTDAANKAVTYTYDIFGRLATRTWARPNPLLGGGALTTTYSYTHLGDMYFVNYNDDTPDLSYQFYRDGAVMLVGDELNNIQAGRMFERRNTVNSPSAAFYDSFRESFNPGGNNGNGMYQYIFIETLREQAGDPAPALPGRSRGYTSNYGGHQVETFDTLGRIEKTGSIGDFITHHYEYLTATPVVNKVTHKNDGITRLTRTIGHTSIGMRVTNVVNNASNGNISYSYTQFDNAGRRLNMVRGDTTPNPADAGSYWDYTYNAKGEIATAKKKASGGAPYQGLSNEFEYDEIGNREFWKTGGDHNGANLRTLTYTSNNLNQYTSVSQGSMFDYDLTGDASASATVAVNGSNLGANDRLGTWFRKELGVANDASAVYATDNLDITDTGGSLATDVNTFVPQNPESPQYDADGNLTRDGRWVYTWTAENRLRRMQTRTDLPPSVPQITLDFKYDYLGRRIRKTVTMGGVVTQDRQYLWNGWRMVQELDANQVFVKGYHWGLDVSHSFEGAGTVGGLCAVFDTTGAGAWESWISFPCYDGNGNVTGLAGFQTGAILAKYEYDAFGRLIRQSGGALADSNPFLFSTKFLDRETGLNYYGYRYYSAEKGRWVNRDPIDVAGGINLYSSFNNNGINLVDFLGLVVDIIFNRCSGTLTATDKDTGATVSLSADTGGTYRDGKFAPLPYAPYLPIPKGDYSIVQDPGGRDNWYGLFKKDLRLNDRCSDAEAGRERTGLRLHLGTVSHGCITACEGTQDEHYLELVSMIESTKKDGNVRYGIPVKCLPIYGTLTVIGDCAERWYPGNGKP